MDAIVINLDLKQIPADKLKTFSRKNGQQGVSVTLVVSERKSPDMYGNQFSVYVRQSQEERELKDPKIYCGSGKYLKRHAVEVDPTDYGVPAEDDAPF